MEGAHRLYDCITEISDDYLKEAEAFCPEEHRVTAIPWQRWAGLAAAAVLVVGLGRGLMSGGGSAPAASAPAASVPAEEFAPQFSLEDALSGSFEYTADDQEHSLSGKEIIFTDGEIWGILAPEEAKKLDLPEDLSDAAAGEPIMWLREVDGTYIPSGEPTGIALYAYTADVRIVSDGGHHYAAVLKYAP